MITLITATSKLVAELGEVLGTVQPVFNTAFYTNKADATDVVESSSIGSFNSTTKVDLVAAPSSTFNRNITDILISNIDTIGHNFRVISDENGVFKTLFQFYLAPTETWGYPLPETTSIKVINSKAATGRTVTTATDTLAVSDAQSRMIANHTGVPIQAFTIPAGVFTIGDTIRIMRIGKTFKFVVANSGTQEINTEIFSGIVGQEIELIYLRNNNGKESWIAKGESYKFSSVEGITKDDIVGLSETTNFIVEVKKDHNLVTLSSATSLTSYAFKTINKTTLEERFFTTTRYEPNRGIHLLSQADSIVVHHYCITSTNSLATKTRINLNGLLKSDLVFQQHSSPAGHQKVFMYSVSGVLRVLIGSAGLNSTSIAEYNYAADAFAVAATPRNITVASNNNFNGGAWDGVDSTALTTSYIYVACRITGILKVDIFNLSISATLVLLDHHIMEDTFLNGYFWATNNAANGNIVRIDTAMTATTYNIGIRMFDRGFVTSIYDATNLKLYLGEPSGTRIVIFDVVAFTHTVWDIAAQLTGGYTIFSVSWLLSQRTLTVLANRAAELSGTDSITITYII